MFSLLCVLITNGAQAYSRAEIMDIVEQEAYRQGLDPSLAMAVAETESNFNASAVSYAGAIGVMQIMPATARGEFGVNEHQLYNPHINARLGVSFLKQLLNRYGREDIALSHYNGGSAVNLGSGRYQVIPATRTYVTKVQRLKSKYYYSSPNVSSIAAHFKKPHQNSPEDTSLSSLRHRLTVLRQRVNAF